MPRHVPDPTDFLEQENWSGGYYELALRLGPVADPSADERLLAALTKLWHHPTLEGPVRDRWTARTAQPAVPPVPRDTEHPENFYGLAHLPGGRSMICLTCVVREGGADGNDWLDLCLPTGAIGHLEPIGAYPFGDLEVARAWREPIDDWFGSIADTVAEAASFEVGLIGFEVSGQDWEVVDGRPPEERFATYLTVADGSVTRWAPTRWDA